MRLFSFLVASMSTASVGAFASVTSSFAVRSQRTLPHASLSQCRAQENDNQENADIVSFININKVTLAGLGIWAATSAFLPLSAAAIDTAAIDTAALVDSVVPIETAASVGSVMDPNFCVDSTVSIVTEGWELFAGRTGSLIHPVLMSSLLAYLLYTGFLGFQWRRQRTMGDEITILKKSLPNLSGASSITEALKLAKADAGSDANDDDHHHHVDVARVRALEAALVVDHNIQDLVAERKDLSAKGPRDQHFSQGALLVFLGTAIAMEVNINE